MSLAYMAFRLLPIFEWKRWRYVQTSIFTKQIPRTFQLTVQKWGILCLFACFCLGCGCWKMAVKQNKGIIFKHLSTILDMHMIKNRISVIIQHQRRQLKTISLHEWFDFVLKLNACLSKLRYNNICAGWLITDIHLKDCEDVVNPRVKPLQKTDTNKYQVQI